MTKKIKILKNINGEILKKSILTHEYFTNPPPKPPHPTFETVLRGMRPQTLSSGTDSWKISEKKV